MKRKQKDGTSVNVTWRAYVSDLPCLYFIQKITRKRMEEQVQCPHSCHTPRQREERLQCYRWDISIPGNVTDMLCHRHWDTILLLYPRGGTDMSQGTSRYKNYDSRYRILWLISACAYTGKRNGSMRLIKDMRL